jgi:stage V sporulation protein T
MEHTGIVRRIDELGRVVIPKEIRRTLQIREGDPLDISVRNATINIKKYHPEKIFYFDDEELTEIIEALTTKTEELNQIILSSQFKDEILKK